MGWTNPKRHFAERMIDNPFRDVPPMSSYQQFYYWGFCWKGVVTKQVPLDLLRLLRRMWMARPQAAEQIMDALVAFNGKLQTDPLTGEIMSTNDVPGAVASNCDQLSMGCWAEHEDGSLILVENTEGDRVVFSVFDTGRDPAMEWRDAMPRVGFNKQFGWPNDTNLKWTWHDKTAFPWDRVMGQFKPGRSGGTADVIISAAQRVADKLGIGSPVPVERDYEVAEPGETSSAKRKILKALGKLQKAIEKAPI